MKAIVNSNYGDATTLKKNEFPDPKPKEDEVLVSVRGFSVNPMDLVGRTGHIGDVFGLKWQLPVILGWDLSGTIVGIGKNVEGFKVGDDVFGELDTARPDKQGTYAELAVIKAANLSHIPAGLSFEEAAALPIAGVTAWEAIYDKLNVKKAIGY